jgi:hypothetical protein
VLCSNCGLPLDSTNQSHCPRCGWPVNAGPPRPPEAQDPSGASWQGSGQPPASAPPNAPPGYPPYPPYGQPGSFPGYGGEGPQQGYPAYGQPTGPSVPLYGQPAPPPGYPPYGQGQGAPPTVPLYGQGAPGGMHAPPSMPMYGQGMPPGYVMAPPARKSRVGLWVTLSLVAVLVVCGTLGLVLASAGALNTATATATATVTATPPATVTLTPSLRVVFQDPLTSDTNGWSTGGQCNFASDGYHIKNGFICYAPAGNEGDATFSVDVKLLSGSTANTDTGITLRRTSQGNYYQFGIDGNSEWDFGKAVGNNFTSIVDPTSNAVIHGGLNTANTLRVVATGSHFDFFVNGTKVGQADDSTFTNGKCGLFVTENAESVFTNMSVAVPQ